MGEAAVAAARAVSYVGAGTVEFIMTGSAFYFMEMNTRLQVEHTVTEAITGIDLVEWQLRIASGEALPLNQEQIRFEGHAIEARVCAEDPAHGFLPSAGRLQLLEWPVMDGVRVDAGFGTGDTVPDSYDSLLGKVIAWGATREEAAARLARALIHTYCAGVRSNEHWLARILESPRFLEVRHNIALLDQGAAEFAGPKTPAPAALILAALALHGAAPAAGASPWDSSDAFSPNLDVPIRYSFLWGEQRQTVELHYAHGAARSAALAGGEAQPLTAVSIDGTQVAAALGGQRVEARYLVSGAQLFLWLGPEAYLFTLDDPRTHEFTASAASGGLTTPLPGVVVAVAVVVGQTVAADAPLIVIEAMKMEHTIRAPYAGTVERIHFKQGDRVPEGSALLELAPAAKA
jgi:3-methylcrotonyl-CoA carboxylase alpha subunit